MPYLYEFQIGPTLATLQYFPRWGIAWPHRWPFRDWAVTETRSNGERAGFGFPTCTLEWDSMRQAMAQRFLNWFPSEDDASVELFLRTYKSTGATLNPATFSVLMHRPLEGQNRTMIPRSRMPNLVWTGVSIDFTHLIEQ